MSRLEELIEKLCPEGIEYKKAESRISLKEKYAFACKLNNQYSDLSLKFSKTARW